MIIEVSYNPNNVSCATLGHFERHWINAELPKEMKALEISLVASDEDKIRVINEKFDFEVLFECYPLSLDKLSNYFSEHFGYK